MIPRQYFRCVLSCFIAISTITVAVGQQQDESNEKREAQRKEETQKRADSLRALCGQLGVGTGCVIADIGAGDGRDTWTFAAIVGESGKVCAEEIEEKKCKGLEEEANKRSLPHVKAILGADSDPKLPESSVDMAFMHFVYHHFSKPHEMLQGIWKGLRPGGYLVIVDQRLGTLQDWVPQADRAAKHHWTAETTVVREAREAGYLFFEMAESSWYTKDSFVLVFQRPGSLETPDRDPDTLSTVPLDTVEQLLPPPEKSYQRVAFVALGEGRKLIAPLLEAAPCTAVDIVLEEWATQKDERPAVPAGVELTSVLTDKGDPGLGSEQIDAVFFLDSYHLLFHGPTLLAQLKERLTDEGCIYVLDRAASKEMAHREASHRRMIPSSLVRQEMSEAGFTLVRECPRPADDRFLLVFAKTERSGLETEK